MNKIDSNDALADDDSFFLKLRPIVSAEKKQKGGEPKNSNPRKTPRQLKKGPEIFRQSSMLVSKIARMRRKKTKKTAEK